MQLCYMFRLAFFLAVDFHSLFAMAMRTAAYLIPFYILATPSAALWQMYIVCFGIVYACTGTGYLLSLVRLDPSNLDVFASMQLVGVQWSNC